MLTGEAQSVVSEIDSISRAMFVRFTLLILSVCRSSRQIVVARPLDRASILHFTDFAKTIPAPNLRTRLLVFHPRIYL